MCEQHVRMHRPQLSAAAAEAAAASAAATQPTAATFSATPAVVTTTTKSTTTKSPQPTITTALTAIATSAVHAAFSAVPTARPARATTGATRRPQVRQYRRRMAARGVRSELHRRLRRRGPHVCRPPSGREVGGVRAGARRGVIAVMLEDTSSLEFG